MSTIRIVNKQFPKKGYFIREGSYDYFTTPEGLPAFAFRWQGIVFRGSKAQFVFARDALRIGRIPDDVARSQARKAGFTAGRIGAVGGGIIISTIVGAIRAATTRTSDIKGFGAFYNNEDGNLAMFLAVASAEIVDEIFNSVPVDKHDKETPPPEPPPAT